MKTEFPRAPEIRINRAFTRHADIYAFNFLRRTRGTDTVWLAAQIFPLQRLPPLTPKSPPQRPNPRDLSRGRNVSFIAFVIFFFFFATPSTPAFPTTRPPTRPAPGRRTESSFNRKHNALTTRVRSAKNSPFPWYSVVYYNIM